MPRTAAKHRSNMRLYRRRNPDRCRRCSTLGTLPDLRSCAWCLALDLEKRLPHMEHDTAEHAMALQRARRPATRCEVSGFTLSELRACHDRLEVDRTDPSVGYVVGNMVLMAGSLNRAKWRRLEVPARAIDALYGRRWSFSDPRPPGRRAARASE